jgi:hypothetical protein
LETNEHAVYAHGDGMQEMVRVVKRHAAGAYSM